MSTQNLSHSPLTHNGQTVLIPAESSPADTRVVNRLFWLVTLAVGAIAAGSFTLSFMALYALATGNGIPALLGWIWPLIVDVSMVIYTAAVLVAQLQGRGARLPVGLTVFYSIVTITGNILHAPPTPLGWFVASLPPLSLILGTEVLRVMARHNIERQVVIKSLAELTTQVNAKRKDFEILIADKTIEADKLASQVVQKRQELDALKANIAATKSSDLQILQAKAQEGKAQKIAERRQNVLQLLQEGYNDKTIAEQLGRDIRTIRADITALNGKAVEVNR